MLSLIVLLYIYNNKAIIYVFHQSNLTEVNLIAEAYFLSDLSIYIF